MSDPRDETTSLLLVLAITGLLAWGVTSWWVHGPPLLPAPRDAEPMLPVVKAPAEAPADEVTVTPVATAAPAESVTDIFVHSFRDGEALLENDDGQQVKVREGAVLDRNLELLEEGALETTPGAFQIKQIDAATRTVVIVGADGRTRELPHISERQVKGEDS